MKKLCAVPVLLNIDRAYGSADFQTEPLDHWRFAGPLAGERMERLRS